MSVMLGMPEVVIEQLTHVTRRNLSAGADVPLIESSN